MNISTTGTWIYEFALMIINDDDDGSCAITDILIVCSTCAQEFFSTLITNQSNKLCLAEINFRKKIPNLEVTETN